MCRVCMGRVCYVPSLLWAEFVMCRVDQIARRTGSESEWLLLTRPNDNHSLGPVIREVSPDPLQEE